jgi:hypothetical protein
VGEKRTVLHWVSHNHCYTSSSTYSWQLDGWSKCSLSHVLCHYVVKSTYFHSTVFFNSKAYFVYLYKPRNRSVAQSSRQQWIMCGRVHWLTTAAGYIVFVGWCSGGAKSGERTVAVFLNKELASCNYGVRELNRFDSYNAVFMEVFSFCSSQFLLPRWSIKHMKRCTFCPYFS